MSLQKCHPLAIVCRDVSWQTTKGTYRGMIEWDVRSQVQKAMKCLQRMHRIRKTVHALISQIEDNGTLCKLDEKFFDTNESARIQDYLELLQNEVENPTAVQQAVAVVMAKTFERMSGWLKQFDHKVWRQPPLLNYRDDEIKDRFLPDAQALQQFDKLVREIEANGGHLPA